MCYHVQWWSHIEPRVFIRTPRRKKILFLQGHRLWTTKSTSVIYMGGFGEYTNGTKVEHTIVDPSGSFILYRVILPYKTGKSGKLQDDKIQVCSVILKGSVQKCLMVTTKGASSGQQLSVLL
ncbi:uncharacterized protein LOC132045171 [Lycium ferocissimum]|uniref:uncharacterized protein LOC132045171 n=1 Tax=Lycium ferocissimum TaxID=112874 RepID=UPI0028157F98|nr:uncharacterized protein LOC132045171 [Lycium ferocissimum]